MVTLGKRCDSPRCILAVTSCAVKSKPSASSRKKVVVLLLDRTSLPGYVDPAALGRSETIDLLTPEGEHRTLASKDMRAIYFVRELSEPFEPERKTFLSRPKLDGLWVRLRFRDDDVIEGIVSNDLLGLLDAGVHLTPPDLYGNTLRVFIPRTALAEMKVLGVVGVARRTPRPARDARAAAQQPRLFSE